MNCKFEAHFADGAIVKFMEPQTWRNVFCTSKYYARSFNAYGIIYCNDKPVRIVGSNVAKQAFESGTLELF